jgi:hypothetical protein
MSDGSGHGTGQPDNHTDHERTHYRLLRTLQHLGIVGLALSSIVFYATMLALVNTAAPDLFTAQPVWLVVLAQSGLGIPAVVVLALLAHYVTGVVAGGGEIETWRIACYAAGIGAVVLPVFNYLMPRAAGQI